MRKILTAVFCLSSYAASKAEDPKPAEVKKPQICWESIELYDDKDFQDKMDPDEDAAKNFKKKTPKYEAEIKEKAEKILADKGVELVECPLHTFDGSGLKRVTADDKPLHLRLSFAYDGVFIITGYVKVEVVDSDNNVVITFKRDKSASIITLLSREKRRKIITEFGTEVFEELGDQINEWQSNKQ